MKTYAGKRNQSLGCEAWIEEGGDRRGLLPRHDLRNHSPDGFEWGYGGSGPAQLALAILADLLGDEQAQDYYQDFKFRVVAALPHESWKLSEMEIHHAIEAIEAERSELKKREQYDKDNVTDQYDNVL